MPLDKLFSDDILLPALEVSLVLFALFAAIKAHCRKCEWERAGVSVKKRGEASMGKLLGWYRYGTAVLVAIPLAVGGQHRVLLVLLNVAVAAYLCLVNVWVRNGLLGLIERASKLEA